MPTAPRRRRRAASSGLWAQKKTPTAVDAFALNENENVRAFPALIMPIPVDIRGFSSTSPASPGLSRFLNYPVPLQFPTVIHDGVLPRKTFSMGEAHDKRFYLEARKIR